CSMWEAVLLSISPSYMQIKLNEGGKLGKILKDFKDNIDRPLAAILTLNTIAHTVGAVGVGQEATKIWAETNPVMTGIVVPIVMTAAILILSEIIPKTLGATNWKMLAPITIRSLYLLIIILWPIVWACQKLTNLFNLSKEKSVFSRHDFLAMAEIGSQEGSLDQSESQFIYNLMHFKNFKAKEIMTPRTVVVSAPQNMPARQFYDLQDELIFSRIPIHETDNNENIIGYILKDEVLEHLIDEEEEKTLNAFRRDIITISDKHNIFDLFNEFIEKREHIALVQDSFGGMAGIITMEDIIETLLGAEIVDETDKVVDMQDMARKQWKNRYKRLIQKSSAEEKK
ncbi:MAG: CNNM domain-containing protein, partial [Pseudomonadota bacterium]|nr:CNNM domain-containing protein [Pseudomonadota bacterium]